ncbi:MAG: hypothetical protein B0D92_01125 [Spirochaeta sp. LUC14_002_19_P3]|nr:MAG: hypothetical protein B0D92_01125 [Spirochaeta sp. LUC14_002_19_P3]
MEKIENWGRGRGYERHERGYRSIISLPFFVHLPAPRLRQAGERGKASGWRFQLGGMVFPLRFGGIFVERGGGVTAKDAKGAKCFKI